MNKIILAMIFLMLLVVPMVSAEIKSFKQGDLIQYPVTCSINQVPQSTATATVSISKPLTGEYIIFNQSAESLGGGYFRYNLTRDEIGTYEINGQCCVSGSCWTASEPEQFKITPSGNSGSENLSFFFIIVAILYGVAFIGFFGKNEWVTILGGMGMISLGIYTVNNGIVIYKDFITNVFSWTTVGLGALFALYAGISLIQDNLS